MQYSDAWHNAYRTARRDIYAAGTTYLNNIVKCNQNCHMLELPQVYYEVDFSIYFLGICDSQSKFWFYSYSTLLRYDWESKKMSIGTWRRLHTLHERLWAEVTYRLHHRLLATNEICAFDADNPWNFISFLGLHLHRPLNRAELEDLQLSSASVHISLINED